MLTRADIERLIPPLERKAEEDKDVASILNTSKEEDYRSTIRSKNLQWFTPDYEEFVTEERKVKFVKEEKKKDEKFEPITLKFPTEAGHFNYSCVTDNHFSGPYDPEDIIIGKYDDFFDEDEFYQEAPLTKLELNPYLFSYKVSFEAEERGEEIDLSAIIAKIYAQ